MRVVCALGGNALLRRGESLTLEVQQKNASVAARAIAELVREHTVIVTHGNGPQVGVLALESSASPSGERVPLDVLDAESQGLIGYLVEQELRNALPEVEVATLLTQVTVDANDDAFSHPTKPIGPVYHEEDEALRMSQRQGVRIAPDGDGWRQVVASPAPTGIVEEEVIQLLVDAGVLVVCAGGGGIPVTVDHGKLLGIEAVIDKDATAALLAERLRADALLLLTDVDGVYLDWGTDRSRMTSRMTTLELEEHTFAAGSMGPKVAAARSFASRTGGLAGIGALDAAAKILAGTAGTTIVRPEGSKGGEPGS